VNGNSNYHISEAQKKLKTANFGIKREGNNNQKLNVYIQVCMYIYNLRLLQYTGLTHLRNKINHNNTVFQVNILNCC